MEVDRVEGKSTGMGKKGRGKGGWNIPWGAGRGFPVDSGTTAGTSLRNCQGGKFKTRGTSYTDLEMRDVECKSFFFGVMNHEIIVGDVITGLVSLVYQAG